MENKTTIEYNWTCDQDIDIPSEHEEALKEDALDRIFSQISDGYVMGELSTTVRFGKDIVPEEDVDDGLSYSGWWSMKEESIDK